LRNYAKKLKTKKEKNKMSRQFSVAVAGCTGAVGVEMLKVLEERNFPISKLKLLASARSAGKTMKFRGEDIVVEELTHDSFKGVDIALFSAGGSISKEFRQSVVDAGAIMIDNSSAFRMDDDVPLVVPEVNPEDVKKHKGVMKSHTMISLMEHKCLPTVLPDMEDDPYETKG
jgi:aspartate-semialdehyde dehydrogenase